MAGTESFTVVLDAHLVRTIVYCHATLTHVQRGGQKTMQGHDSLIISLDSMTCHLASGEVQYFGYWWIQ